MLLGEKGIYEKKSSFKEHIQKQPKIKEIRELPEKNNNYRGMYAYLNKTRCIDIDIINDMVNIKNLYEEKEHNNCVFLGKDKEGQVKYCLKIGTNTFKKFKGEIPGSDKRFDVELYSFSESKSVCVYESIIDAMSYATLIKQRGLDYKKQNLHFLYQALHCITSYILSKTYQVYYLRILYKILEDQYLHQNTYQI